MRRPNILFLFTDEQRADTMAAYGNATIDTPHLNQLARESVVFEKCYVTQPVCTPSRSSILTGLWPHTNGCTQNNIPLSEDTPCLPEMLPGHRAAYFGKWHLGDELFAQHGFEHWVSIEDMYARYYRAGRSRDTRSTYHHWLVDKGYTPENVHEGRPGVFSRSQAARLPEEHCKPAFLAQAFTDWLTSLRADEPFIAYVNFLEPHMPFTGPRDDQYPPETVELPRNFAHIPDATNHLKARMLQAVYHHEGFGGEPLNDARGWRRLIARYWGLVSQVDAAVGRILEQLAARGLDDHTIVVYTSDHGDMMGSHQLLAKTVMFEEAVTVPLLMRAPGLRPRREGLAVSQIDLVPSLLDCCGAPIPDRLQGQSLKPLLETGAPPAQPDAFIEWSGSDSGVSKWGDPEGIPDYLLEIGGADELLAAVADPVRTIITCDRWKLNYSPHLGTHELFNLNADPYEWTNLHGISEHRQRVKDMKARLVAWGRRYADEVASEI